MPITVDRQRICTLDDLDVSQKRVFVRADLNVPIENEQVQDDTRIRGLLPTLTHLCEQDCQIIIASHLGRPKAKPDPHLSLLPVAQTLSELLKQDVVFADDCIGDGVRKLLMDKKNKIIVLENLRFHPGEKENHPEFVHALNQDIEVYVNDAFGTLHRSHASITGLPNVVKQTCVGRLVEKELKALEKLTVSPTRPYGVILGGAKISDKIKVVEHLIKKVDRMFIGGAMAFTFLKANGVRIGDSLHEPDMLDYAKKLMKEANARKVTLFFPRDFRIAQSIDATESQVTESVSIEDGWMGLDVGPKTIAYFSQYLGSVKTLFWNGPMGMFERAPFDTGTVEIAKTLAGLDAVKIIGGGDSVAAIAQAGVASSMTHVSTGGGATLAYIQDPRLVGLQSLMASR